MTLSRPSKTAATILLLVLWPLLLLAALAVHKKRNLRLE